MTKADKTINKNVLFFSKNCFMGPTYIQNSLVLSKRQRLLPGFWLFSLAKQLQTLL